MVEYRLNELSRISGASTRNIRAYRERGLLDPPRRQGRSAFYTAFHLARVQLRAHRGVLRQHAGRRGPGRHHGLAALVVHHRRPA
ncbi:MerR family transcriptional regulator [Mycolicibacterium doricum]|uniref:MerR family transcriptional regulator n=1 Tax=Mycolicibacterium doricum TaxID=126673 RepID=UPI001F3728DF|nr:MerR family transcriptional regulator [Mycolicibacterium doricum]